jgi:hypothetical protein
MFRCDELSEEQFREMFLKAWSARDGTRFFNNMFDYVSALQDGNCSYALKEGLAILCRCRSINATAYKDIHKGDIFYWLGTAAFGVHDFQTATFFYDAALSEDIRDGASPTSIHTSPAIKFILVEAASRGQWAQVLVKTLELAISEAADNYRRRPGVASQFSILTIDHIRKHFLQPAVSHGQEKWRSLATTFHSFLLEWNYRRELLECHSDPGTSEPFFLHLFKGCLLFESLLKANRRHPVRSNATLGPMLRELRVQLQTSRTLNPNASDFGLVLNQLVTADSSITACIELTGKTRNTLGHSLGWSVTMNPVQYEKLFFMIAASCLHVIAALYVAFPAGASSTSAIGTV